MSIAFCALFFAAMGVYALAAPAGVLRLFDIALTSADGRSEVRAVYGGYGLAMAAVLLYALYAPHLRDGILLCVGSALVGMVVGRLISAVAERPGPMPIFFGAVELGLAAMLLMSI